MDREDLFGIIVVTAIVIIPVLAIVTRMALRLIVETIVRLRDAFATGEVAPAAVDRRLAAVEAELRALRSEVERIAEIRSFDAQLRAREPAPALKSEERPPQG